MSRAWWVGAVFVLAACRQLLGIDDPVRRDAAVAGDARGTGTDAARDARPDGPLPVCDPTKCSAGGGTCQGDACAITASGGAYVTCPVGEFCEIFCSVSGSCPAIDCSQSAGCLIACDGTSSCDGAQINCNDSAGCTVYCTSDDTCTNDQFECGAAGCDVECCGIGTCTNNSGNATTHTPGNCPI